MFTETQLENTQICQHVFSVTFGPSRLDLEHFGKGTGHTHTHTAIRLETPFTSVFEKRLRTKHVRYIPVKAEQKKKKKNN